MDPDINDIWSYSWRPIFQAKKAYNQMMGSVCITPASFAWLWSSHYNITVGFE
jgi:hypothetical protein